MIKSEPTTHIRIKISTKIKLDHIRDTHDTYDDAVQELLDYYDTPPEAIE